MRRLVAILCWTLASPVLAINIGNVTISDTLVVPAGERGNLYGTITLDGGVISVDGSLYSELRDDDVNIVGAGRIELNLAETDWNFRCCSHQLTIGPEVEILGSPGASYSSGNSVLRGVIAAVAGETAEPFELFVDNNFVNEGVLEVRSGAIMKVNNRPTRTIIFNQGGMIRALPGGVVQFEFGEVSTFGNLGTFDNQGEVRFHAVRFDAGLGVLQFPTGDWTLFDGAQIRNATVTTEDGGRLLIREYKPSPNHLAKAIELRRVAIATDLHVEAGEVTLVGSTTLEDVAIYFSADIGNVNFDAAMTSLQGTGSIVANGGVGRLRAAAPQFAIPESIGLESRAGTLVIGKWGSGSVQYDIAAPMTADGGRIQIATQTTVHGPTQVRNGGVLEVDAILDSLGSIQVESGGQLIVGHEIRNEGSIVVSGATVVIDRIGASIWRGEITGSGTFSIADSLVVVAAPINFDALAFYSGPGVDYAVRGNPLDLNGAAISLGSAPGTHWFIHSGGTFADGIINSLDGTELVPSVPAGFTGELKANLHDIELNANARIPAGASVSMTGALTGSGQVVVDGGKLVMGTPYGDSTALLHSVLDRIETQAGEVSLLGTILNQGQTLRLPAGVRWGYSHSRADGIVGGRIEGEPGAELHVDSGYGGYGAGIATFNEGVTVALPVVVSNSHGAYVRGGLTLDRTHITIGVAPTHVTLPARLFFLDQQTLEGVGEVRFGPTSSAGAHFLQVTSDLRSGSLGLSIGAHITVRTAEGNGKILDQNTLGNAVHIPLTNHGLLLAENGHRLELYTEDFAQQGTLRTEADSLLIVHDDDVVNQGRLELAGGQMKFTGELTQASGSVLAVELSSELLTGGVAPLAVEGNAFLGGGLELTLADGFAATLGDRFPLLSAASLLGRFTSIVGPVLDEGYYWRPEIVGGELWLSVDSDRLAGDYNFDGVVDAADYVVWRNDLTLTGPGLVADGDGDLEVDAGDYEVWRANYGRGAATLVAAEGVRVPEPASWVVVLSLLAATRVSRRVGATR